MRIWGERGVSKTSSIMSQPMHVSLAQSLLNFCLEAGVWGWRCKQFYYSEHSLIFLPSTARVLASILHWCFSCTEFVECLDLWSVGFVVVVLSRFLVKRATVWFARPRQQEFWCLFYVSVSLVQSLLKLWPHHQCIITLFSTSDGVTSFIWSHHQCITSLHHSAHLMVSHNLYGHIINASHHCIIQHIWWHRTIHLAASSMCCIIASFSASDGVAPFIRPHHQCITSLHHSVHLLASHHIFGRIINASHHCIIQRIW